MSGAPLPIKPILSLLLTVTFVVPFPIFAQAPPPFESQALGDSVAPPVPAGMFEFQSRTGKVLNVGVTLVPAGAVEDQTVKDLQKPGIAEKTAIFCSGLRDRVCKGIGSAGSRLKAFVLPDPEHSPIVRAAGVSQALRAQVVAKAKSVGRQVRENPVGVLLTFAMATGMYKFNYYFTSSSHWAAYQFASTMLFMGWFSVLTHSWFSFVEGSEEVGLRIAKHVGVDVENPYTADVISGSGAFVVTYAVNVLSAYITLRLAGIGDFAETLTMAFVANYNLADSTVKRWFREGKLSATGTRLLMALPPFVLGAGEVAAYFNVENMRAALGSCVALFFVYSVRGVWFEHKLAAWRDYVRQTFRELREKGCLALLARPGTATSSNPMGHGRSIAWWQL